MRGISWTDFEGKSMCNEVRILGGSYESIFLKVSISSYFQHFSTKTGQIWLETYKMIDIAQMSLHAYGDDFMEILRLGDFHEN